MSFWKIIKPNKKKFQFGSNPKPWETPKHANSDLFGDVEFEAPPRCKIWGIIQKKSGHPSENEKLKDMPMILLRL